MNWPSMWEDITDRAAESPRLQQRKLSYEALTPTLRIVSGDKPKSQRPRANDDEAAKWRARQKERQAAALEARTRRYADDLRAWNEYIHSGDIPPDKDATGP